MSKQIQSFFRDAVRENFPRYASSLPWDERSLKLDSGENLWGPKLALDWNALIARTACYPDANVTQLRTALANDLQITSDQIAVGNGSDELIDLCCRLFLNPGDQLLDFSPTFPMFAFFGKLSGARVKNLPRTADFGLDLNRVKMEMAQSKLAFLANPNNPTGTLIPRETIIELLRVGTPLVVDEAYFEFAGETVVDLVDRFENLIVLRTFSKWAGIAGLRVGFMVANPVVIERILAIKAPYNVNTMAQAVALEVLKNKSQFMTCLREIRTSRDWFVDEVNQICGLIAIPSRASCVTILCGQLSATTVATRLAEAGVLVKVLPNSLIPNALRVSIAPKPDMVRVVALLRKNCTIGENI